MTDAANSPATLIVRLASADPGARQSAAAALYRCGQGLADPVVRRWSVDAEFAALLVGAPTIGVAATPENFEKIRAANGSPRLADVPPDQDAKEFELVFAGNILLDILTTRDPGGTGAIARFLEKLGQGIQQVEYPIRDVDRATDILRTRFGQQPIYPQTRSGADSTRVNFFLASTPEGKRVLIELVESRAP
jgi:hypothetical protein